MSEALPCAEELSAAFADAVRAAVGDKEGLPTVSVGIAFAHHSEPLQAAVQAARDAEHAAKRRYGRSAVSVHVLKRSGEEVRVGTPFRLDGTSPLGIFERLVEALSDGALAAKFPSALMEEATGLSGSSIALDPAARKCRVEWIAARHSPPKLTAQASAIGSALADWADALAARTPGLGIEEIARWSGVARFIASGGRDDR